MRRLPECVWYARPVSLTGSGGRSLVSWIRTVVTVGAMPRWWRGHCRYTVVVVAVDKIVLVSAAATALLSSRAYLIAVREIVWRTSVHPHVCACAVSPTQTWSRTDTGSQSRLQWLRDGTTTPIVYYLHCEDIAAAAAFLDGARRNPPQRCRSVRARRRIVTKEQIIACVALWQY